MNYKQLLLSLLTGCMLVNTTMARTQPKLDLQGYADANGAIAILNAGDTTDPYFALQALLLAHDNGLDITVPATKFANWLVSRQKPDGTFDRFCLSATKAWVSCKTADADDSLLALWMRLLETMPEQLAKNPVWQGSHAVSKKSLDYLFQPSRGIYMVSPVYLHGLFMDNLEVWSLKAHSKQSKPAEVDKLAQGIHNTFWQPVNKSFLVSTQLEQRTQKPLFYPDHVAQIFPLLVDFPILPQNAKQYYKNWMQMHRAEWLRQGDADYPWGLLAVLAVRQGDEPSARCWLRETSGMRHSRRWAVTDEAAYQILASRRITPASKTTNCQ
ncbi:MAG: hypothetical protein WBK51_02995 [Polaromonas sp.]